MTNGKAVPTNITLFPDELEIVQMIIEDQKLRTKSAAIRHALWQWLEERGDQQQLKMENGK